MKFNKKSAQFEMEVAQDFIKRRLLIKENIELIRMLTHISSNNSYNCAYYNNNPKRGLINTSK